MCIVFPGTVILGIYVGSLQSDNTLFVWECGLLRDTTMLVYVENIYYSFFTSREKWKGIFQEGVSKLR